MKNEKLLTVLIIAALILSIVSTIVSIMSLRRIKMHDDLLQAMQVLVYTGKLAEDIVPENVLTVEPETAANEAQGQEQQADAQQAIVTQADKQARLASSATTGHQPSKIGRRLGVSALSPTSSAWLLTAADTVVRFVWCISLSFVMMQKSNRIK